MRASTIYLICYPPRGMTGLRHVVRSGDEKALCGVRVEEWYCEVKPFDPKTIGCKRCSKKYAVETA